MLFNSFEFLIFFPVVTILFFLIPNGGKWSWLLLSSCFFYMFFKPEYILILAFTIVVDYYAGILIEKSKDERHKKRLLILSLVANIGVLAIFKYYNFLDDQISGLAKLFGYSGLVFPYLKIILPIGLSFHTFQAMSYTIEIYRGNYKAEKHFGIYALYVMFYPQLVAGPIERPQNLLHQFREDKKFQFENLFEGLKRIVWGLFKKVVIADRLAVIVDYVYKEPTHWHGGAILLTMVAYAIQIYCDFSGYSDIAVGTARVMGFKLLENFNYPFRSKSITEFWRRWHISLQTWFNDYLFTPILIDKRNWGNSGIVFAIIITFSISGLWHGASWTFILFGVLHGVAMIYEFLTRKERKKMSRKLPSWLYNNLSIGIVFFYACVTWVFFRSLSLNQAFTILANLFTPTETGHYFAFGQESIHGLPSSYLGLPLWQFVLSIVLIPFLFIAEKAFSYQEENWLNAKPRFVRWTAYYILVFSILVFGVYNTKQFIYFQF
jgi:alginate O-acetyltransferase complex protein AlgI